VARRTLIINLPGSSGGVRDGMKVLRPILVHAVDQIRGGDHPRPAEAQRPAEGHRAAEAARPPDSTAPPAEAGPAEAGHQGHAGHALPGDPAEAVRQHASDDATGQKLTP
jgi:hypothetical protein